MGLGQDQQRPFGGRARNIHAAALGAGLAFLCLAQQGFAQTQQIETDFLEAALDDSSNVIVVVDSSGSMTGEWSADTNKFEAVQSALTSLGAQLPQSTRSGVVSFGHRRNFDCSDIEVLTNPSVGSQALLRAIDGLTPQDRGMRPLADAIETAAARLSQQDGAGAIVVLTDGGDECGGNICALAGPLAQLQIPVHVVGIGMSAEDTSLLRCLPANTSGSFVVAQSGDALTPHISKALSLSHTANAQRSAASIARLLLQDQDIAVRELDRVRNDMGRLDDALSALNDRVQKFAARELLTEHLEATADSALTDEVAIIREAATRLTAQLGSRDQMLIRMQRQTDDWNAGTLGLSRQADLASAMAVLSDVVEEPAEKLRMGHARLVERRAALETEMAATAAQSAELHGRLGTLEENLEQVNIRIASAQVLAQRIEAGERIEEEQPTLQLGDQSVLTAIAQRDEAIARLQTERGDLLDQLQAARADLAQAQTNIVSVEKARADADQRVREARDLLASLQANQHSLQSNWKSEVDNVSIAHLQERQAIESKLDGVLAEAASLRTELARAVEQVALGQAQALELTALRDEALETARLAGLSLEKAETQNQALMNGLAQCRMGQEDLSNHIAALEADIDDARSIALEQQPDSVNIVLANGIELGDALPSWSIEDATTDALVTKGTGSFFELPKEPGQYRVVADLAGQLVERTYSVRAFGRTDHELALDLARLELDLDLQQATAAASDPVLVKLTSPLFSRELEVMPGEPTSMFVPASDYRVETDFGLSQWSEDIALIAGDEAKRTIAVKTLPVALDLVAGERDTPISEELRWSVRDARAPAKQLAFRGPQADLTLEPGVYDVEVAFDGFVASQTFFIDASDKVDSALQETVRFNDGAVRLAFSNNGEAVPEGLDLEWRIELQGAAIVTSQTLDGDLVQLPAGGYHLSAKANDVQLDRDFLVLAGQVTELAPDFTLGQVTLRLLDEGGAAVDDGAIDWSVIPQQVPSEEAGFKGAIRTGDATQTLLLPEGRYRVTARTGDQAVQRLISVRSGDKSSFGLIVSNPLSETDLADLGAGQ